jgi:hypothetical protein
MASTNNKPDSEYKFRIVRSANNRRVTWHSMECATGKNAKYFIRTIHTPETRRDAHSSQTDHMAKCCLGKAEIKKAPQSVSFTASQARKIFEEARVAGRAAGVAATPKSMVVGTPTTLLGDDIDSTKPTYYVPDGVCGFAWVVIRPGNSSLARHAVKLAIGGSGGRGGGGVSIWVRDHDQSLERKNRHARAYAEVLGAYGVTAYAESRMD